MSEVLSNVGDAVKWCSVAVVFSGAYVESKLLLKSIQSSTGLVAWGEHSSSIPANRIEEITQVHAQGVLPAVQKAEPAPLARELNRRRWTANINRQLQLSSKFKHTAQQLQAVQ